MSSVRPARTHPSIPLIALGLLVMAVFANEGLRQTKGKLERRRVATSRELLGGLAGAEGEGPLTRALSQVSYEARRIAADVLWFKLDAYVHEGPVFYDEQGRPGVGYFANLDIVPLYRLITWLDPHFIEAYRLAGTHLVNTLDRPEDAVRMWEEGIANNRSNPRRKELLGELAVHLVRSRKEYAKARACLEDAMACIKENPRYEEEPLDVFHPDTIRGLLVICCHRTGDLEAGLAWYRLGHNLAVDHPAAVAMAKRERERGLLPVEGSETGGRTGPGHLHDSSRVHDHESSRTSERGAAPGSPRTPGDPHRRPWMEPERVARLQRALLLIAWVDLVAVVWRAAVRRRRLRGGGTSPGEPSSA